MPVIAEQAIFVGIFEGFSWIRCEGKGSFVNSPVLKAFADERVTDHETCLVVDLAGCTGMDSTFMGTLAGIAARMSEKSGGCLQIAEPGERNRRSLEDLGLDFLMEIEPPKTIWREHLSQIRSLLAPPEPIAPFGGTQRTRHVLEAHQTLSEISEKNARTFSTVVDLLQSEISGQDEPKQPPSDGRLS